MAKPDFSSLSRDWRSPYVTRDRIFEFTCGLINPRTLANRDAKGTGPKNKIRVGRKVAYEITELIQWISDQSRCID